jgi:hypothetical protein
METIVTQMKTISSYPDPAAFHAEQTTARPALPAADDAGIRSSITDVHMESFLMSGPYQRSIAAYRDNRVSGAIEDADPHRLVALLLSGARERLNMAQAFMQHKRHGAEGA